MNTSSLKHEDVVVNLSSGNAATVSVFNLEAMIMSMLTDDQIYSENNQLQNSVRGVLCLRSILELIVLRIGEMINSGICLRNRATARQWQTPR
jgi:hypothetical protein